MTLTLLDLHCLNALCDDYENVVSVTADVRRSTHGNVSENEIRKCLAELKSKGWVSVYEFDSTRSSYNRVECLTEDWSNIWFFINDDGRKKLHQNWVDA